MLIQRRTYMLGEESELTFAMEHIRLISIGVLTPFGRKQLCECIQCPHSNDFRVSAVDLGISTRLKYGFLLQVSSLIPRRPKYHVPQNFTETNTIPVFRTESQSVYALSDKFCVNASGIGCSILP